MLKQAALKKNYTFDWTLYIAVSVFLYVISLISYLMVLKYFPISQVMPVMTMGIIMLVVIMSYFIGERINIWQLIGIFLGMISIYLIFAAS
jgi:drug/metabolite transporter (DMT)-like permease